MTWIPSPDRMIVLPEKPKDTSEGGLAIPTDAQEQKNYGTVVAAGHLVPEYKVGDFVMYMAYAGSPFEDGKDTYLVLNAKDILARKTNA